MSVAQSGLRVQFFTYLFGEQEGNFCVAYSGPYKDNFTQKWFDWPEQRTHVAAFLDEITAGHNVWFCTSLFSERKRTKEYALPGSIVWADLDYVDPLKIQPRPTCSIRSSADRYQAYWRLEETIEPKIQEDYNKRLEYKVKQGTKDDSKGGWDITQLLRVPYTYNYKPEHRVEGEPPLIEILHASDDRIPTDVFDSIYIPDEIYRDAAGNVALSRPLPDPTTLPTADQVLYRYLNELNSSDGFVALYNHDPPEGADWSKLLWRLVNICLENGLTPEETLVVANEAACNKYKRDNRPTSYLWRDICKADESHKRVAVLGVGDILPLAMPVLTDQTEVDHPFINEYKEWALDVTDAPEEYHELSALILLSAVLCSNVKLEASFGELVPNLWGLILGGSTLTRKTTAMEMALNMLLEIDNEILLATDASPEGLLTGLSHRPNRVSIFYRDEVFGLFDSINHKPYLAGLPEIFTKLYDVPRLYTRLLRKENVVIEKPHFIFFGGGIKEGVLASIDEQYIASGFLPRFLIVSGETDRDNIRPTGPATDYTDTRRSQILASIGNLIERYHRVASVRIPGNQTATITAKIDAKLTPEAWEEFARIESVLRDAAFESQISNLALPTFTRLGFSLLKMGILLGCARREPLDNNTVVIEQSDLLDASVFIQRWGRHTVELLMDAGKSVTERTISKVLEFVKAHNGCLKSEIMNRYHFTSREMTDISNTLMDRGLIDVRKAHGRGQRYYTLI